MDNNSGPVTTRNPNSLSLSFLRAKTRAGARETPRRTEKRKTLRRLTSAYGLFGNLSEGDWELT